MEAALEKGRPLPDWYLDEPKLERFEEFYIRSFWDLHTERSFGWSEGPIPWSKIRSYAIVQGLNRSMINVFVAVVRAMDGVYLKWCSDEREKRKHK